MYSFDLFLLGAVSIATAVVGWIAGRGGLLSSDEKGSGTNDKSNVSSEDRETSNPNGAMLHAAGNARAGMKRFGVVVDFGNLETFRRERGDRQTRQLLERVASHLQMSIEDSAGLRVGRNTIDFVLVEGTPQLAELRIDEYLELLANTEFDVDPASLGKARAAIVDIGDGQASHSAFDKAHERILKIGSDEPSVVHVTARADNSLTDRDVDIMRRLRHAIETNQVTMVYQPKLHVKDIKFRSAEALFRWDDPATAAMPIGDLIGLAERLGVIGDLTLWSLERAITDQLILIDHGIDLTTHVNLSARLLSDSDFTLRAIEVIKSASGKIGIEITETAVIGHHERALANLELYAAAGAKIAIDDYGTGLSSLRYLKKIPAQELKIDREFISEITSSHRDPMIVRSTIDLAHALGLKVTAEGVDDATKLALLSVMGCDQLQGFHIAKPLPLGELIEFVSDAENEQKHAEQDLKLLPRT